MKREIWLAAGAAAFLCLAVAPAPKISASEAIVGVVTDGAEAVAPETEPETEEVKKGWVQEADGNYYYYNLRGVKQTGLITVDSKVYYLDPQTGARRTGVQKINGKRYFFDPETGQRKRGWITYNGNTYYFCSKWYAVTGMKRIRGSRYYFNYKGVLYRNTIIRNKYAVDADGKVQSGWCEINGKRYYADPKNYQIKRNGWYRIDGESYYFESDGSMRVLSGVVLRNKKRYYYDASTGEQKTGWVDVGKNRYYFSPRTGAAYTGWHRIKGKYYYFSSKGKLYRNRWVAKKYYVDAEGVRQYGWITLDGNKYYLNEKTGRKTTGWATIGKYRYYFDKNGVMQKDKWVNNRYLKSNGRMAKSAWVGGVYVDKNGKKTSKTRTPGFFSNSKYTYYLSDTYEKQKGWIVDNEKYYHFDTTTARMDKNKWVDGFYVGSDGARLSNMMFTLDGSTYLFLADGTKATGIVEFEGKKYYFLNTTGARQTGFITVDGYTYYFDPNANGAMAVNDEMLIGNVYYSFDANGHIVAQTENNSDEALGQAIAAYAQRFIGNPYVWGGTSLTNGADCSGFVQSVFAHFDIKLPRTTYEQYPGVEGYATPIYISEADLKPGDLVFYYANISHVGIYIGDGKIVHASNSQPYPAGGIKISSYDYTWIKGCVRYW